MKHKTTFAEWLKATGIPVVAEKCGVTTRTAYYWLNGRVKPSPKAIEKIVALAPHLSINDILGIRGGRN